MLVGLLKISSCLEGGGGLQMIINVELINFSLGNTYCQYHKEHYQFHTFSSKLNTQRAVALVSWVTEDQLLPRRRGWGLLMISNVELTNFSVGNAYCQYHKEHFQFHTFFF